MKAQLTAISIAFITVSCVGVDSPTQETASAKTSIIKEKSPKPYPWETCLVSGEDLDEMDERVSTVYNAQTFEFCCKPCLVKFNKNPKQYLSKFTAKSAE